MIGKIVVGFLVFCLTLVCIFSFDSAFDYTYESSGPDDYVKVDMKTPTDINEQLLDQSLGRTFSFVGTVGSWVRDVWDRGITMFSYISGSFDYRVENELYFDSLEEFTSGIEALRDELYGVWIAKIDEDGGILINWRKEAAYDDVYGDDFCMVNMIANTSTEYSFFADCHPLDYGEYSLFYAESWAEVTGLTAEAVHTKFAAAGLSHYYNGTYWKYIIQCPPVVYGPPAPEDLPAN